MRLQISRSQFRNRYVAKFYEFEASISLNSLYKADFLLVFAKCSFASLKVLFSKTILTLSKCNEVWHGEEINYCEHVFHTVYSSIVTHV